jgi:serine-type D-Ala-D-Ala carboxypeptidase (penicillin-binding protein 5/6)
VRPLDKRWTRDWGRQNRPGPSRGILLGLVSLIVVLALLFGVIQLFVRSTPPVRYVSSVPTSFVVPGAPPALPFPKVGEATVGVLGVGTMGSSGGDASLPIASLTKMMTAYVILTDHPLAEGQEGPLIGISAEDVNIEAADAAGGQSVVKVAAGEQLSELQCLEALLVGSANNIGTVLARWDGGSIPAFVARLNAKAAALGMKATHYADPTGVNAKSVSSASDQVLLAQTAMENHVFAGVVGLAQIDLPVAGTVFNYDFLVGHNGVVGIKTGSTAQAGGCFVFAAIRSAGGAPVVIIGAVIGQRGRSILQAALDASLALINAAAAAVHPVTVSLPSGGVIGRLEAPWAPADPVVAAGKWSTLGWGGLPVGVRASLSPPPSGVARGAHLGSVTLSLAHQTHTFAAVAETSLGRPSLSWRLKRS